MKAPPWLLPAKPVRLLILFSLLLAVVGLDKVRRWWSPTHTLDTTHYHILSSAQSNQTAEIGAKMAALYSAYTELFSKLPTVSKPHAKLKLKLYRDQREFKRCNRVGWAEAYYRPPYCHAYFSAAEINPHHWMLHEGVHQLNHELAHLNLPTWADEGLSDYLGSSLLRDSRLEVGHTDRNSYPIWWLDELQLSGDLNRDLTNGTLIPLRAILTGRGGPSMNKHFNLYYLHWWSLTHMLFDGENGRYRDKVLPLLQEGATLQSFENHIGPVERVQAEWYQHLRQLQWDLFRIGSPASNHPGQGGANREPNKPAQKEPAPPRT